MLETIDEAKYLSHAPNISVSLYSVAANFLGFHSILSSFGTIARHDDMHGWRGSPIMTGVLADYTPLLHDYVGIQHGTGIGCYAAREVMPLR